MIKDIIKLLFSSILAGISISCGCVVFLKVGGLWGAVLFSFGLLTVVHYGFTLYTGTAGFVSTLKDFYRLILILIGNIAGCWLAACCMKYAQPGLSETCLGMLEKRLEYNFVSSMILGAGCGFIMTTSVQFAREKRFLPLLFGVPLFIMCGFLHSIADAFYYLMVPAQFLGENLCDVLTLYLSIVIGNFIGCNLYRLRDCL